MSMRFVARDKTGRVVETGDLVTDFRGEEWTFIWPTRPRSDGRTGKVLVEHLTERNWHGDGPLQAEYYDTVFDLAVTAEIVE